MSESISISVLQPQSCDGCGLCCEGIGSPILEYASRQNRSAVHPHRPPGLTADLIAEIDEHFLGMFRGQEPRDRCLWFDPALRRCRHYELRPQVCRDYELGGDPCLALRQAHHGHS